MSPSFRKMFVLILQVGLQFFSSLMSPRDVVILVSFVSRSCVRFVPSPSSFVKSSARAYGNFFL